MSFWKGGYIHECNAHIDRKEVLDPLVLKIQEAVSCLMLVLGPELGSSTVHALNH